MLYTDSEIDLSEPWTFVVGQRLASGSTWAVAIQNETSFSAYHHEICSFSSSCGVDGLALYNDLDANGACWFLHCPMHAMYEVWYLVKGY